MSFDPVIEIVNPEFTRGRARWFLFDFDGTISTLRHGWETVMRPLMREAVMGAADPGPGAREEIGREIDVYIERSTGIQTVFQMAWLAEYTAKRGLAPARPPLEYKAEYNRRLAAHIADRTAAARAGARDRFIIPGSREFLTALSGRGLNLAIFSGTDQADVEEEAVLLGVRDFFRAGIHGSGNDMRSDTKKKVITDLVTGRGLAGAELVIIGDGPVEIRCAREAGAVGIGVTCREATLEGRDPAKYRRVKEAGADIIITDFRGGAELIRHLVGV